MEEYNKTLELDGEEVTNNNDDVTSIPDGDVELKHDDTEEYSIIYKSDIKKAHRLLLEAAKEHPKSSKEVQPVCFLEEYGDSAVMFTLYFWVDNIIEGRKKPKSEVLFSIWDKFEANNIEIPFPQRDVHVKNIGELK